MFKKLRIRDQFVLLSAVVAAALLILAAGSIYSLKSANDRLRQSQELSINVVQAVDTARLAQVDFKKQVQEWKDTLIRGTDPQSFDKYQGNFKKREESVRKDLETLAGLMGRLGLQKDQVEEALKVHAQLGERYHEALKSYNKSSAVSYLVVDRLVKGMDRPPTDAIDGIVSYIWENGQKEISDAEKRAASAYSLQRNLALGLTIAMFAVVFFLAWNILRGVLGQLGGEPVQISGILKKISQGDLAVGIKDEGSNPESMVASMTVMAENLRGLVAKIKMSAASVSSASQQLSATSEQTSRGASSQAERSLQIATSASEMSQTVLNIARNASDIAATATTTSKKAHDGEAVAEKSAKEVKSIAEAVRKSAELTASLGHRSREIGEIVGVIKDIADQTNLLALNAAIEAARAGERGQGFAVVADEVRQLAERTSKATAKISEMIAQVQREVENAVSTMDAGTKNVEVGVEFVVRAGDEFHGIAQSVEELHSMVQQIASATEQMSAVSEQISGDIDTISNVSQENSASARQISQSASDLARLSSDLQGVMMQFQV